MVVTEEELGAIRARHKDQRVVLAGGTFDLLHVGHLDYLEASRAKGDVLVVMLANDVEVRQRKGPDRPITPQDQRARLVDSLKLVDYTVIRIITTPDGSGSASVALRLRPDVLVLYNDILPPKLAKIKEAVDTTTIVIDDQPKADSTTDIIKRLG